MNNTSELETTSLTERLEALKGKTFNLNGRIITIEEYFLDEISGEIDIYTRQSKTPHMVKVVNFNGWLKGLKDVNDVSDEDDDEGVVEENDDDKVDEITNEKEPDDLEEPDSDDIDDTADDVEDDEPDEAVVTKPPFTKKAFENKGQVNHDDIIPLPELKRIFDAKEKLTPEDEDQNKSRPPFPIQKNVQTKTTIIKEGPSDIKETIKLLKDILVENIEKVKDDPNYIPQAKSINNDVNSIINLARLQIQYLT